MRYKKLVSAIALLLVTQFSLSAAYSLVIHRNDGKDVAFLLEKKPVVTFDATSLSVECEGDIISVSRDDIKNIEFTDGEGGLIDLEMIDTVIEVIDRDTFRFNSDNLTIRVYDMTGREISSVSRSNDGKGRIINLASCSSGIYIITCDNSSFKYIKR